MEALLLQIGTSVSGLLLKLWLEDKVIARLRQPSLGELIERAGGGPRQRRTLKREFERIADEITNRLEGILEVEFRDLPPNEREATALTLRDTLEKAPISDELLFATDLDPADLEEELRRSRPNATDEAHLSEAAASLYRLMLREVSSYIVEIRITLPDFNSQASREILARETELIRLVQTVLERLPEEVATAGGDDAAAFEGRYRRAIARKLDQLELFGVTTSELTRRYSLSVAYLTLTASAALDADVDDPSADPEEGRGDPAKKVKGQKRDSSAEERAYLPVDKALSHRPRSLIRGEAGSGKTTLLQWLAVTSARREFDATRLDLNDRIPFFIQLRQYVDTDLPGVDDFVGAINRHLADTAPVGWVRDQLHAGRGLILIDGVDELPEERREEARGWLIDLIEVYPDSRFVVTSRPPAVADDWLERQDFGEISLEPMDPPAIRSFIDHWHEAAGRELSRPEDIADLETLRQRLRELISEARPIRNLASSPLLAAMLCALNRDRRAKLPSDRIELYRIAMEMLLDRRDVERDVRADEISLGLREKEILLRHFALWLLTNGQSDARRSDLEGLLENRLEGMSRVNASAPAVVEHLLLRSGLLRQPVEGRIDFIHRTFQEYLGAKEAIEQRSIGLLVEKAHLDQWQEVIVLAAGLSSLEGREELIGGLIQRSEEEGQLKHRLQLLAVGCLETSPELSPQLQSRLEGLLHELIPPSTKTEAKAIASAGEVAVPLLGRGAGEKALVAAACVRALALIGGESSMSQLANFGPDQRVTVSRELLRAWGDFPTADFAARVLADSALDHGTIQVSSAEELASVQFLNRLRTLRCDGYSATTPVEQWNWPVVANHQGLRALAFDGMAGMSQLPSLRESPTMSRLELRGCRQLRSLSGKRLPDLRKLSIVDSPNLERLEAIDRLGQLEALQIADCPEIADLPSLPDSLRRLYLQRLPLTDIEALGDCEKLTKVHLDIPGGIHPKRLASAKDLEELVIEDYPAEELDFLAEMAELDTLKVGNCPELRSAASLETCPALDEVVLRNAPLLDRFDWLEKLERVSEITLLQMPNLESIPALGTDELMALKLSGCSRLTDISALRSQKELAQTDFRHCTSLRDISALAALRNLHYVDLEGCSEIEDLSPLFELPELIWIDITGCRSGLEITPLMERGVRIFLGGEASELNPAPVSPQWIWRRESWYHE